MKGKGTSRICRVCLRIDKYLKDINPALSKFHYELCLFYTPKIYNSQFCAECEHMLKKVYNFKEKCKKAAKLYHDFIHNLLPGEMSLINITELYKCMPESPLGHWIPSNNRMFSYEEGVNTELDEIDNIEISGEIKHRSLKTYCKPKYIAEKTHRKEKNSYKECKMLAAKRWAENKTIPTKTPFKVHDTNTVPNVSLLAKTPSKLIVTNTESNKKVISKTPGAVSVVSNQSKTYNISNIDDDNDYEDSIDTEQDPLDIPVRNEIPNTAKPETITKECSVVLTPLRIFKQLPVATPNMLKTRSDNTPLATIQEVVSSDKTLSKTLPKYLIIDGDRSIFKESQISVSGKLAGNVNSVPNKASLMRTPNAATMQEKNIRQNNVTTTYLLYAEAQKLNTPSTKMPVEMLKDKNTTLNTTVQKVNTPSKHTPLKTTSEDPITKPNLDTSVFNIEYPKPNLQDLLSSNPNSEVIMEDDIYTDWDYVVEIESTQLVEIEPEEFTLLTEPKPRVCRKLLDENSTQKIRMDRPISRKRSPTSIVSFSSNGHVIFKEKTQNSYVNESNQWTNDNAKRIKMNQHITQSSNVKNIGSNGPSEKISTSMRRKAAKELLKYSKERLKAALLIKFATCGELKSEDIVIDKEFVMECLDQRVPEKMLRRLWRYVLYDIKGRKDSKMSFSPNTLRTFRFIQKRYINEKIYQDVFDIQYLTTEKEVLEEFQMRKHYARYINATYRCHICYHTFQFSRRLENHMKYHVVNPGDFACEVCSIRFPNSGSLSDHKELHKAVFKCKLCPLVTHRWNAMVNHYNQHIGMEYKCIPCGTSYKSISTYRIHMGSRLHGRVVCTTCGRNFKTEIELGSHQSLRHKNAVLPEDGASVQCDECPLAFPSQEVLLTHKKRSHELVPARSKTSKNTKLDCRVCGAKEKNLTWLKFHFRKEHPAEILDLVYADIKSHLCHYCGHGCTTAKTLTDHIKRHTGKRLKQVACNLCRRQFFSQRGLRNHSKTHNCVYKCSLCGKTILHRDGLIRHLRRVHKLEGSEVQPCIVVVKKEQNIPWGTDGKGVEGKTKWGTDGKGVEGKTEWGTDGKGVEGKTEWGKEGEEGEDNTARSNDGKEENTGCGNNGEENTECGNNGDENTAWGNDGEENTAWGNDGVEENTECGNNGEENTAWGNDGVQEENTVWGDDGEEEENTECGNGGEEENTVWGDDGEEKENVGEEENTAWGDDGEENIEWDNGGEASATEEVAEEIETWTTDEEIVEDTVWGTTEDVPVWITEVQNEEEVPAGEEMELE